MQPGVNKPEACKHTHTHTRTPYWPPKVGNSFVLLTLTPRVFCLRSVGVVFCCVRIPAWAFGRGGGAGTRRRTTRRPFFFDRRPRVVCGCGGGAASFCACEALTSTSACSASACAEGVDFFAPGSWGKSSSSTMSGTFVFLALAARASAMRSSCVRAMCVCARDTKKKTQPLSFDRYILRAAVVKQYSQAL